MALCIRPEVADRINAALASGQVDLIEMYEMENSEQRKAVWEKFVGPELAQFINLEFERAFVSESATAIDQLVEKITGKSVSEEKTRERSLLDKIKKMDAKGLLDPNARESTFTDLVSESIGITLTKEEIQTVSEKAANIEKLSTELKNAEIASKESTGTAKEKIGLRKKAYIDYFNALTDMDRYINSQSPTRVGKVITGSIFRGNMLLNIAPATVNLISNSVQGAFKSMERRIALRQLKGSNSQLAQEYFKLAVEVFHKTGYDISRMFGEEIRLGENLIHNEGPSVTESKGFGKKAAAGVRKVARGQGKLVFKYLLGYADVVFASAARADYSNVAAAKIAQMRAKEQGWSDEKMEAYSQELLEESTMTTSNLLTETGKDAFYVKTQAISEAESATWTNKSFFSEGALKIRDVINKITGDLQLGFWTIPFVKTGANVIQFGIDATPVGMIRAVAGFSSAQKVLQNQDLPVRERVAPMQDVMRLAARSGLGFALSAMFVAMFDPEDFYGGYDVMSQTKRDQLGLKKGVYNAVKIGDKWISLDYFGPLAPGIVGMMYAKKYGDGAADSVLKYAQGIGQQTLQIPGVKDFEDVVKGWEKLLTADSTTEFGEVAVLSAVNSIRSRAVPGLFGSIAKGIDKDVAKIDRKTFDQGLKSMIPGLRGKLPAKVDITTGKNVKGEGFWSNLLFGSRVKTANESRLIDEMTRLERKGQAPTVADIERSSKDVQGLKRQVSQDRFQAALKFFGREYGRQSTRLIRKAEYRRASDEDKRKMLNGIRSSVRKDMLEKFNYRKPKKGRRR